MVSLWLTLGKGALLTKKASERDDIIKARRRNGDAMAMVVVAPEKRRKRKVRQVVGSPAAKLLARLAAMSGQESYGT